MFNLSQTHPLTQTALIDKMENIFHALREGQPIILCDDINRENEADLIVAAEKINEKVMAMLIRECSGIVCLCLDDNYIKRLNLEPMAHDNQSRYQTAFTVSIEARNIAGSGVSARDRVQTILTAIDETALPDAIVSPGHVFPIQAKPGGVLERQGHTEGSVDLARLAGLKPAAILCELMNPDGTMMRGEQVEKFADKHQLFTLTIEEIIRYRQSYAELK